jgi:hypothetical protein
VLHTSTPFSCCCNCCVVSSIHDKIIDNDRLIIVFQAFLVMLPIKLGKLEVDHRGSAQCSLSNQLQS